MAWPWRQAAAATVAPAAVLSGALLTGGRRGKALAACPLLGAAAGGFSGKGAPSCDTACATTFPVVHLPFCSPFPATATVVAPSPPEQPPVLRLLARPAGRRPPQAELGSPAGARGPLVPPLHFPRRRRASSGRHREPPTASSALIHVEDFALEFEKREGSFCKVSDSKE